MANFVCHLCPKENSPTSAASFSILKTHFKDKHSPNIHLHIKCLRNLKKEGTKCQVFGNKRDFSDHLLQDHKGLEACDKCDFVGTKKNMPGHKLRKHKNQTIKVKKLKCSKCNGWKPSSKLEAHVLTCKGPASLQCKECDKYFSEEPSLNKHITNSHKTPFNKTSCDFCPNEMKFKVPHLLRKHIQAVHNEKWVQECKRKTETIDEDKGCNACQITFSNDDAKKEHERSHKCPCCQRKMSTPSAVIDHLRKGQTDLEIKMQKAKVKYADFDLTQEGHLRWCVICMKAVNNLQTHQNEKHTCTHCTGIFDLPKHELFCKSASQSSTYQDSSDAADINEALNDEPMDIDDNNHVEKVDKKDSKVKDFKCDHCDMEFEDQNSLGSHKLVHQKEPSSMEKDSFNATFDNPEQSTKTDGNCDSLNDAASIQKTYIFSDCPSQNIKSVEITKLEVLCEKCSKVFDNTDKKKEHLKAHKEKCHKCDKSFCNPEDLAKHFKFTHDKPTKKAKPFNCNMCKKTYASNKNLEKHKLKHNGNPKKHKKQSKKKTSLSRM